MKAGVALSIPPRGGARSQPPLLGGCHAVLIPESPGTTIWSGDAEHRYTEELILPGETLYALGQFTSIDPLQTSARDDLRDLVIAWKPNPPGARHSTATATASSTPPSSTNCAQLRRSRLL
ncbi:hypothetical protein [Thiomonas sp. FB-Cd]|uniref:hypothetical protein n=1 Tax=Thiomonas sp. FB-Cd TaxID=1158292 RepID=UPI000A8B4B1B|nr:hypothetical protein [Thiomonas sp. FB-Cd]